MGILSSLFGNKKKKIDDFISRGAIIVDVRSREEYESGAIPGSKHIPVQNIESQCTTIKQWNKPVICVCASGGRSASATTLLKSKGVDVLNGGTWVSVNKLVSI